MSHPNYKTQLLIHLYYLSLDVDMFLMPIWGVFLESGYLQIINLNRIFHYKPSILGYPHFRKPSIYGNPHWRPRSVNCLDPNSEIPHPSQAWCGFGQLRDPGISKVELYRIKQPSHVTVKCFQHIHIWKYMYANKYSYI